MPQSDHETVAECAASATGQYLKPLLERASVKPEVISEAPTTPRRKKVVEEIAAE